jgi:hypothetical protein
VKLSHGAEVDIDTDVTFEGDTATVCWWWVRDSKGRDLDDGKEHTATFRWKATGGAAFASGYHKTYDIELVAHTGDAPSTEIAAYCEDLVVSLIADHVRDQADSDRT